MSEKPLYVRVAEARGWRARLSKHGHFIVTHGVGADDPGKQCEEGYGRHDPEARFDPRTGARLSERTEWWDDCSHVPRPDTDWSATGPEIERYGIALTPPSIVPSGQWYASVPEGGHVGTKAPGPTPLIAACRLILALAATGKLTTVDSQELKP